MQLALTAELPDWAQEVNALEQVLEVQESHEETGTTPAKDGLQLIPWQQMQVHDEAEVELGIAQSNTTKKQNDNMVFKDIICLFLLYYI